MNKTVIIILSAFVLVGGFFIFYQNRPTEQNQPAANQTGEQTNNSQKWETKTDNQANVTVAVTPIDLSAQSTEWKFNVVMDTHSVELDQNLVKDSLLVDDNGNEFKPTRWDGPTGGHHKEGVLVFNSISPLPQSLALKITGITNTVRIFIWQLNK